MKDFAALFAQLDGTTRTGAKLEALELYQKLRRGELHK